MIRLIAALDQKRGIAKHGYMPWNIPADERYFTDQTKLYGGVLLTGKTTFVISYKGRPLAGRDNYILTHETQEIPGVTVVHDLAEFLEQLQGADLWVAGGASVFEQVMNLGKADELYLTAIDADFGCDQFFPPYEEEFKLRSQSNLMHENGFTFYFAKYQKRSS